MTFSNYNQECVRKIQRKRQYQEEQSMRGREPEDGELRKKSTKKMKSIMCLKCT